ncbi:MAG: methylmalonyl Co-A mutase-associated GTPase MeaB [Desulfobacteraceae bacterium]|nr:MAG: methylmalonyl Co-A mutase-associated GTPase MeaB [Desulfobacteraceae bacterium]
MTNTDQAEIYRKGLLNGDRRLLSRAITLIESSLPLHQQIAGELLDTLLPYTGKAIRLGITGVPGVGKSTFIESIGIYLTAKGHRIAVLAVDPSSKRSGGSILADKTRMEKLSIDPNAFIRPSPSGGTLGGVARKTRETMLLCEAAGFDIILVETVGVGQSETTVASMVDFFLVLMLAGAGDELQGIKKGVLELADAVVINKADGDNIKKAQYARKQYENALHLLRPSSAVWSPPVQTCSALEHSGMDQVWDMILSHREKTVAASEFAMKRKRQSLDWMWSMVEDGLQVRFEKNQNVKKELPGILAAVEKGEISPTAAANRLLFFLDN